MQVILQLSGHLATSCQRQLYLAYIILQVKTSTFNFAKNPTGGSHYGEELNAPQHYMHVAVLTYYKAGCCILQYPWNFQRQPHVECNTINSKGDNSKQPRKQLMYLSIEADIARGESYNNAGPVRTACGAPVSYKEHGINFIKTYSHIMHASDLIR